MAHTDQMMGTVLEGIQFESGDGSGVEEMEIEMLDTGVEDELNEGVGEEEEEMGEEEQEEEDLKATETQDSEARFRTHHWPAVDKSRTNRSRCKLDNTHHTDVYCTKCLVHLC